MAIVASDIVKRYSVVAAAGDTTAGTAATSLGDQISTTVIPDTTLNSIFNDVTGAEAAAGKVVYRCIFVLNNHATLTYTTSTVAIQSQTAGGSTWDLATDNLAVSAKGLGSAQAAVIGAEGTAPSGVSAFGAGPLSIGDIAPGQVKGVWIRQTTLAGASSVNPDGAVIVFSGDSL